MENTEAIINMEIEEPISWINPLRDVNEVSLEDYLTIYKNRIIQESEILFVREFLYPLFGKENIKYVVPQFPFLDSEGRTRRIDFAIVNDHKRKLAFEVNGEVYHAEGIIPSEAFDDNLNRQNEIITSGYHLLRFSFTQLQHPNWRKRVSESLRKVTYSIYPELLSNSLISPNPLQKAGLDALNYYRGLGWKKGIVILPTGTGKTFLSAFDSMNANGRILFVVHRLDILSQSREAFEKIYTTEKIGLLTGEVREFVSDSKILFASKDTLRNPDILNSFKVDEFDYIIIDEVHHGQAPSYQMVLEYFKPSFFMLGLTATPDRMDRKDIFELFDYQKVFEYSLNDAIENGYLVPYTYYGLKDNIDYSKIKYQNNRYNVHDLDRHLIIKERNEQIFAEYQDKGKGYKAVGFCCSVNHAEAMAKFFTEKGIPSCAITSQSPNKEELIQEFRQNKFPVAFTVDLFNEGIDFPDLRVLLFLRPTESKTIFMQQLGRGLRLCNGKENVIILDFISNYRKANDIRKFLAKGSSEQRNASTGRVEKVIYEYSPKCEVKFDVEVEQILDSQDLANRDVTKEDLIQAYYDLAEKLARKPTQQEINAQGEYKIAKYTGLFDSWVGFLREINEFTESGYHFPQGVHLGHALYILHTIKTEVFTGSNIDPKFIRFRGGLGEGRYGAFQRQTKYKLQALMEMGLIVDDRKVIEANEYKPQLTPKGDKFYQLLAPMIKELDLSFKDSEDDIPSWDMTRHSSYFNEAIYNFIKDDNDKISFISLVFLEMPAVVLMLNYLYRIERKAVISKNSIYTGFFSAPFVSAFCDQNGIDPATVMGAEHRCPFLLNILEAIGLIKKRRSEIELVDFLFSIPTLRLDNKETEKAIYERIDKIFNHIKEISGEEMSKLKEAFGKDFLTNDYFLKRFRVII